MFRDIGMRMSKFNRRDSIKGISQIINSRNYQYIDAMKIAIEEDSIAYFQKLNAGAHFEYKDFKLNEETPKR